MRTRGCRIPASALEHSTPFSTETGRPPNWCQWQRWVPRAQCPAAVRTTAREGGASPGAGGGYDQVGAEVSGGASHEAVCHGCSRHGCRTARHHSHPTLPPNLRPAAASTRACSPVATGIRRWKAGWARTPEGSGWHCLVPAVPLAPDKTPLSPRGSAGLPPSGPVPIGLAHQASGTCSFPEIPADFLVCPGDHGCAGVGCLSNALASVCSSHPQSLGRARLSSGVHTMSHRRRKVD